MNLGGNAAAGKQTAGRRMDVFRWCVAVAAVAGWCVFTGCRNVSQRQGAHMRSELPGELFMSFLLLCLSSLWPTRCGETVGVSLYGIKGQIDASFCTN